MAVDDSYTKALLHMDGADASTTFTDESGKTWTVNGNAQIDTAQFKFGGASGLFDGAGDYLNGDGSADFAFGTGDFTVDFWFRMASSGVVHVLYDSRPVSTNGDYPTIYVAGTSLLTYVTNTGTITGTTVLSPNVWHHIALVRSGTSTKLFLNGIQEGSTFSDTVNYLNPATRPTVGSGAYGGDSNGWIDELRVSKGIARWTSNFTPPTQAYPLPSGILTPMWFF